jgi:hypothetical protein
MKFFFNILIAIIALISIIVWNIDQNKSEMVLSDVMLENIEALADGEFDFAVCAVITSQTCIDIL